jgi:uracil-DNA glycosylase
VRYKLLVFGEAPGRDSISHSPSLALTGASGRALCGYAGWGWLDYLKGTERVNLFMDPQPVWMRDEARESAVNLLWTIRGRRALLLGGKVAQAFGVAGSPHYTWMDFAGGSIALMPHPSGRNRMWNEQGEKLTAHDFLQDLLL